MQYYRMNGRLVNSSTEAPFRIERDMTRERNKPSQSWTERTKIEIEHEEELTIERAYELGKIRGRKEQEAIDDALFRDLKNMVIEKACEWLKARNVLTDASLQGFRKAMVMVVIQTYFELIDLRKEMEEE